MKALNRDRVRSNIIGIALAMLLAVSLVVAYRTGGSASATLSGVSFESEYAYGTKLSVPKGTLTVDGSALTATAETVYPDGTATVAEKITLNQAGDYNVYYRAEKGGRVYTEKKSFNVYQNLYGVGSSLSSVSYGESAAEYSPAGINVSLATGDVFTYNQVIDLSDNVAVEDFLKISITPTVPGQRDFDELFVYLTDVYDPANVLTISFIAYPVKNIGWGYARTAAPGQQLSGYEQRNNHVCVGDEYGFPIYLSFEGVPESTNKTNEAVLRYDHDSLQFHSDFRNGNTTLIADHDDSYFFPKAWGGFTTGEVTLSIKGGSYAKNTAGFTITKIGNDDLSGERAYDTAEPNISVDMGGYTAADMPEGEVGTAYPVFAATAADAVSGTLRVNTNVYTGYYTSVKRSVPVQGGTFTPTIAATHYIEYSAVDGAGNNKTVVLTVPVTTSLPEMNIAISPARTTSGITGEELFVADYTVSGGSGTPVVVVTVEKNGKTVTADADGSYRIFDTGSYEVVYTATDYLGQTKTAGYSVEILAGDRPVFLSEPVMPRYLIAGMKNNLPKISAYNYTNGSGAELPVTVIVKEGGTDKTVDGFVYTPGVSTNQTVTVTYSATLSGKTTSIDYQIPVVVVKEDGSLNLNNYFVKSGVTGEALADGIEFSSSGNGSSMEFINSLLTSNLKLEFSFNTAKPSDTVNFYLTDSEDSNITIKISYVRQTDGTAAVYINGNRQSETSVSEATFLNGNRFTLKYEKELRMFTVDLTKSMRLVPTKTLAGDPFTGFGSGKVYMAVEFEGSGATGLRIQSINGQQLNAKTDNIAPEIDTILVGPEVAIGSQFTIPRAFVGDVIDPGVVSYMTVWAPDGTAVTATDGTLLKEVELNKDYTINLPGYGAYEVEFYARDSSNRVQRDRLYTIRVRDKTPPIITLSGSVSKSYKAGTIVLPTATAADNLDGEVSVSYFLLDFNGRLIQLDKPEIKAEVAGTYTIRYLAYDKANNLTMDDYTFTVTE